MSGIWPENHKQGINFSRFSRTFYHKQGINFSRFSRTFYHKQGQGFKVRAAPRYPNLGWVPPSPGGALKQEKDRMVSTQKRRLEVDYFRLNRPLSKYAPVPANNNPKSRLRTKFSFTSCIFPHEASTSGYCSPEVKRKWYITSYRRYLGCNLEEYKFDS